jgi:hypothetical protein
MIWIMPSKDNERGKQEWIDASCGVTWHWFRIAIRRELDLGEVRVVESLVEQSREATAGEDLNGAMTAEDVVVDI